MDKMTKGRSERSEKIELLKKLFEATQGGVLTDFRGLDVAEITDLRRRFREVGVDYQVVKNTLTRIAVTNTSYESLSEFLKGPTGVASSDNDAFASAKVAIDYAKENGKFQVKCGFIEGSVLSLEEVKELSTLGSKEQLLSQFLSVLNGPTQKFLGVLNGVPQKFLGTLQARADKMENE